MTPAPSLLLRMSCSSSLMFLLLPFLLAAQLPVVTVTIDAPTNVVVKVVLTNTVVSPPQPTNAPPVSRCATNDHVLYTSSGPNDIVRVYKVRGLTNRLIWAYRPPHSDPPPVVKPRRIVIPTGVDISPGGIQRLLSGE